MCASSTPIYAGWSSPPASGARAKTHLSSASSWPERSSIPWSGGRSSTRRDRLRHTRLRAARSFHSGEAAARNLRLAAKRRLASGLRWHVAGCHVGTRAEEVAFHLLREILACARVCEAQPILVDEHRLVLQPLLPSLFGDILVDPFA